MAVAQTKRGRDASGADVREGSGGEGGRCAGILPSDGVMNAPRGVGRRDDGSDAKPAAAACARGDVHVKSPSKQRGPRDVGRSGVQHRVVSACAKQRGRSVREARRSRSHRRAHGRKRRALPARAARRAWSHQWACRLPRATRLMPHGRWSWFLRDAAAATRRRNLWRGASTP